MMQQEDFSTKRQNTTNVLQKVRHTVMGVLFIVMAVVMFFPEQLHIEKYIHFDAYQRYAFGGICVIYGAFRLFRVLKNDTASL